MDPDDGAAASKKTITVKGKVAVDELSPYCRGWHVYEDSNGPWSFTGNQTHISANNNKVGRERSLRPRAGAGRG